MNFLDFIRLAKKIYPKIPPLATMKKLSIVKKLPTIPMKTEKLYQAILRQCYKNIFPDIEVRKSEYLNQCLPFTLQQISNYHGPLINIPSGDKWYGFSPEDVLSMFHSDLNMSNTTDTIIDGNIITTLDLYFRVPHNSFESKPFSESQMKDIVSQLIYYEIQVPLDMPEVKIFLDNFEEILNSCKRLVQQKQKGISDKSEKKINHEIKIILKKYFEKKGLLFFQDIRNRENYSRWVISKNVRNENWWEKYF